MEKNQTNTFLLSGTQNYSVDNNTLIANNGQISKQALEVNIFQNGLNLESIVNFGVSPFTFFWSTGETTQNITSINAGNNYFVVVQDNLGCIDTSDYFIASGINELSFSQYKQLNVLYDLSGKQTDVVKNKILLYLKDDGTIIKRIIVK